MLLMMSKIDQQIQGNKNNNNKKTHITDYTIYMRRIVTLSIIVVSHVDGNVQNREKKINSRRIHQFCR